MKILIIEDNRPLAKSLRRVLEKNYAVQLAYSGEQGSFLALTNDYDLIVLDLTLPDMSGLEVCHDIRREKIKTPILILTAKKQTESKVILLNAGADDYLAKPFSLTELKARIRALLRRSPECCHNVLRAGPLVLNPATKMVYCQSQPIKLSKKEFLLLNYLMRHPNVPLTRLTLFEHIWDNNPQLNSNTVDAHICNLRRKIRQLTQKNYIQTVYGLGYKLVT